MDDTEARQLLIDAGVPEERIDAQAIMFASVVGDTIARAVAQKLAEKLVKDFLPNGRNTSQP